MSTLHIDIDRKAFAGPHGEHLAIQDLRLDMAAGEFVCLVGPSGCGKTTLLNLVAGLDPHYEGSIRVEPEGRPPHTSFVFQNPRLLPWRTVRQNIDLALPPGADAQWVDHLLQVMGLEHAQSQYPERLSLGMSRRVALVRAFAVKPDLLLMDEPFVSLDPPTARRVRALLLAVWAERPHTVLFVTHDLREAIALADRLVFLSTHPMSSIAEIPIATPRTDRETDGWIEEFRQRLLQEHPVIRHLL
ncbi:ABC transporter ATP-binding protein [Methylococcus sp. EFPC2]|uniref:ABC transporter ATP-binding protein n=1 Tax=Methylococcus sp. EFPC2 TaxID=2812648 RepID=UPI0019678E3E|nr:ATP-binding cassette domain-containing protein [Methylococcus sp. EFPC2]QSA95742.1 ATP-binding cassette domain-containing protein [Methylococcus sp. EFPC2]